MEIIRKDHGRRYVGNAYYLYKSDKCAVVEIDLHLKHPEIVAIGYNPPSIIISASATSMFKGRPIKKAIADIVFPKFHGWEIKCAEPNGRYTITLTLLRNKV